MILFRIVCVQVHDDMLQWKLLSKSGFLIRSAWDKRGDLFTGLSGGWASSLRSPVKMFLKPVDRSYTRNRFHNDCVASCN